VTDINLSQDEADILIAMPKFRADDREWDTLPAGGAVEIPLHSEDRREAFLLDMARGTLNLAKCKYQNRARQAVVLVRLDLGGAPHRNPDLEEVACPHLHVYREGYGDKWARALPPDRFADPNDLWCVLQDFMAFCTIVEPPIIRRGLFT
jgi:hypothetical protein